MITTHLSPTPKLRCLSPLQSPSHHHHLAVHLPLPLPRRHRHLAKPAAAAAPDLLASVESVASAASVLAAIVLVHESGHFLAAASRGIHVSQFSIGFGPALARFRLGPVEYALRAIPLGGYVGFPDDDPESGFSPDDPDLLRNRPVPDRLLVVSAGVAANLAFAFLIVYAQALTVGVPVQAQLPGVLVPEVLPGSAAARAGLLPGDIILAVPGAAPDPSVPVLVDLIKASPSKKVPITVSRTAPGTVDRQSVELTVVPDTSADGTGRIGVQLSPNFRVTRVRPQNLADATVLAVREFTLLTGTVFDGLRQTLLNFSQSAEKVSGPVAIIAVGAEIPREVEQGIMSSGILVVLMIGMFLIVRDTLNLDFIKEIL
ncbi:Membrane metalloprotease ARASP, chloroplastic [Dichanthelium oligosanthes]|uniref:Membrane metalloprotease ARASP, chloroplastic n=1 Tax=Dichanthelium oligosanthes TaxID=888268 RepID=A0A1E5VV06_9POAL|nr:Membrane metalloprotease ARASP, chloroplastic [Dichanthelium oligosanthes]